MQATDDPPTEPTDDRAKPSLLRRLSSARLQEAGLLLVIALLWIALTAYGFHDARPGRPNTFLNPNNLIDSVAKPMSLYAIMAIGVTCVIIAGGIDISVASILALSALVTAWTLQELPRGTPALVVIPLSLLLPLVIGLCCGLLNGTLVVGLRIHPFIVTLGTLSIFRGLCNVLPIGDKTVPTQGHALHPSSGTAIFAQSVRGLEIWPMVVMLGVVALGWFFLLFTVPGRETFAVGGNEEAARFSGIRVGRAKLRVYAISGMLAGLAGLVYLGRFGSTTTNAAPGYELTVIAAAVVGGASLSGGRGTALGALLGTLVLATIENAITKLHWNDEYRQIIVGLSIIVAVALDRLSEHVRKRSAMGAARR